MKGTIDLHEKWGWGVMNHMDESIPDWIPLHPDDLNHFAEMNERFDNFEARVLSSPEVEFETIIHPKFTGRIIYAKLNTKEEPKQETLEGDLLDTAIQVVGSNNVTTIREFLVKHKWQQERMYIEEDLLSAFEAGMMFIGEDKGSFKEWFEQFKKK
jgi:hypothetical protein